MREYALIMMSMINYAGTYLKKKTVLNMREFCMRLMQHINKVTVQFLSSYRVIDVFRTLSNIKIKRFAKGKEGGGLSLR